MKFPKPGRINGNGEAISHILVFDDSRETREATEELLRVDGYEVRGASDEDAAIEQARSGQLDLILVSTTGLPEQILRKAKGIRNKSCVDPSIPVVVFSMLGVQEGTECHLGENVYLIAPDNFNQLRALLKRLLQSGLY